MSNYPSLSVPEFYQGYVGLVDTHDVMSALKQCSIKTDQLLQTIPDPMVDHRYAEGKWTVKQLLCHVIDAERIFAYRALRFARGDKTELSGFEEKDYAEQANHQNREFASIKEELRRLKQSTIDLFGGFSDPMLQRIGITNGMEFSVEVMGFIIAGHGQHHLNVLRERYLS